MRVNADEVVREYHARVHNRVVVIAPPDNLIARDFPALKSGGCSGSSGRVANDARNVRLPELSNILRLEYWSRTYFDASIKKSSLGPSVLASAF